MADHNGPGRPMVLFELYWASGGASGTLQIHAPTPEAAVATVRANPSAFGVPHEHPIVGHATRLHVRHASVSDERPAA